MWFGLAKMAISTGAKIYANKQKQLGKDTNSPSEMQNNARACIQLTDVC